MADDVVARVDACTAGAGADVAFEVSMDVPQRAPAPVPRRPRAPRAELRDRPSAPVELAGGPDFAHPTCQIVPTGFRGHRLNCPYTVQPTAASGWRAPDIDRARRLVTASGRAGERVTVWVPDFKAAEGRYFVTLLTVFRARMRVVGAADDYFGTVYDPRTRAQMGFMGWASDFLSPSSFLDPNFTCAPAAHGRQYNASYFCDREVMRRFALALAGDAEQAAEHWAAAERRVVDAAPAVPIANGRVRSGSRTSSTSSSGRRCSTSCGCASPRAKRSLAKTRRRRCRLARNRRARRGPSPEVLGTGRKRSGATEPQTVGRE